MTIWIPSRCRHPDAMAASRPCACPPSCRKTSLPPSTSPRSSSTRQSPNRPMSSHPWACCRSSPPPSREPCARPALRVPDEIEEATRFSLFGRRIRSMLYSTDVAVIRNANADAVFAVYPFTAPAGHHPGAPHGRRVPRVRGRRRRHDAGQALRPARRGPPRCRARRGVIVNSPASAEMVSQIVGIVDIPRHRDRRAHRRRARQGARGGEDHQRRRRPRDAVRPARAARELPHAAAHRHGRQDPRQRAGDHPRRRERHHLDPALGADAAGRHDAALPRAQGGGRGPRALDRPDVGRRGEPARRAPRTSPSPTT